jgi:hypothetical protein
VARVKRERGFLSSAGVALVAVTLAACDQGSSAGSSPSADAGSGANEGEGTSVDRAAHGADADTVAAEAHAEAWGNALKSALSLPCRAIAVDGHVAIEGDADAGPPAPLALRAELPSEVWLTLGPDSRLVAKDPRTTRETAFTGPARVRPCVAHREESWLSSGAFESAIGAGETPGAEEWVVTTLGVARYMAAQLKVDVRARDATVTLSSGAAFLWLPDDTREAPAPHRAEDGGPPRATTTVDDDGWRRMTAGALVLAAASARAPADAAAAAVTRCLALTKEATDLAAQLLAGAIMQDAGIARDQVRTRLIARAACSVAALRVEALPASKTKTTLGQRMEPTRGVRGLPSAAGAASGARAPEDAPGLPPTP